MDLEATSLQPSAKAVCLSKLREYKSDLNQLNKDSKRVSSPDAKQSTREELMESGMADLHAVNSCFSFYNLLTKSGITSLRLLLPECSLFRFVAILVVPAGIS